MRALSCVLVSAGFLLGLNTCGGGGSALKAQNQNCVPGETRACVGPGACQGAQACSDDGSVWSACNCGAAAADAGAISPADSAVETGLAPNLVLIDDMEGTTAPNGPILISLGAADLFPGYWGAYRSAGNIANTLVPDPFSYSVLPAPHETQNGVISTHAAHITCSIADLYGFCEEGFWFAANATEAVPVDISKYSGIVFWGMSSLGNRVKVHIANIDTSPSGGKCGHTDAAVDQCWDSFSTYVTFTNTWQRFEVKFSDLYQEGWGYAAPSRTFDATTAYTIFFQVNGPQNAAAPPISADFWVDDVYFE